MGQRGVLAFKEGELELSELEGDQGRESYFSI